MRAEQRGEGLSVAVRVLLVEDHELLVVGFQQLVESLDLAIDCVASLEAAGQAVSAHDYGLLVQDLYLPDGDGLEFCQSLRAADVQIPTILISGMLHGLAIQRALDVGIEGIIAKDDPSEALGDAVTAVLDGGTFHSPRVASLVESLNGDNYLTPRAAEVLDQIVQGLSNKQIAAKLGITEPTVSFHLAQLKKKLGARTNRQLVFKALRLGLAADPKAAPNDN